MSADRCSLAWKAAALEDGRLEGSDRASFEKHASRCEDCRAELRALAALSESLEAFPATDLPPLEHARRRGALLSRANERFTRPGSRGGTRLTLLALAVVMMGGITALVVHSRRAPPITTITSSSAIDLQGGPPRYDVVAGSHAIWRDRIDGTIVHADVADGEVTFHVEPMVAPQRFLVSLPDGELEVTGTRFTVDVALGRTRSVNVLEGQVILRRQNERELTLGTGEGWSRAQPTALLAPVPSVASVTSVTSVTSASASVSAPAAASAPASASLSAASAASATSVALAPTTSRRAGEKFDEAVGTFMSGSYARADVELHEFLVDFPRDARSEDAAFLSAVARWRMGDVAGARTRAQSYLASYPTGLRRAEAQRMLETPR